MAFNKEGISSIPDKGAIARSLVILPARGYIINQEEKRERKRETKEINNETEEITRSMNKFRIIASGDLFKKL